MKWNIDKALVALEPETSPGTSIHRVLADVKLFEQFGVKPKPAQLERGHGFLWVISLGKLQMPKAEFYGHTIREAYLKAQKAAKADKLASSWGDKIEVRGFKSSKPPQRKLRRVGPSVRPSAT